jgi:phage gp29-like protein
VSDTNLTRVFHDLPITSYSGWDRVWQIEGILAQHDRGYFRDSSMLVDAMMRDDRIGACADTRVSALTASPVECKPSSERAKAARVAKEIGGDGEFPGLWSQMFPAPVVAELSFWGNFLGVAVAQILWDTSGTGNMPSTAWQEASKTPYYVSPSTAAPPGAYKFKKPKRWTPRLKVWHPQYLYWDWATSRYIALCMEGAVALPNTDEQVHGDGKWFVWAPRGYQYGWLRGQVRRLAHKYIMRGWDYRDWARYCERHGMPIIAAKVPSTANQQTKDQFKREIANMASEAVIATPDGGEGNAFGLEVIEATARTWQSFQNFKKELDDDIAISLLGQNLSTDAEGGSYALGQVQEKVRIDKRIEDAKIDDAFRAQVLWWDAGYNYDDPDLAPIPEHQVEPPEDESKEAATMLAVGQAITALNTATPHVIDERAVYDRFGFPMRSEDEVAQRQEDAQQKAMEIAQQAGGGQGDGENDDTDKGDGGAGAPPKNGAPPSKNGAGKPNPFAKASSYVALKIVERDGKFFVYSEDGSKPLGGPYDSRKAAEDRLHQVEYFKHRDKAQARALRAVPEAAIAKRYEFQGLPIAVETPAGGERYWSEKAPDGSERVGSTTMLHDYGYIDGHTGADGEELDCYVGDDETARFAYVVHQRKAPGYDSYDEDKVMLGQPSADAAKAAYLAHRDDGEQAFGGMSVIPMDVFKSKLKRRTGAGKIRAAADTRALEALVDRMAGARALRSGRTVAGAKRAVRYADQLERNAVRDARKIVAGDLGGIMADLKSATSYEDLRDRVLARYREKMRPDDLAELVKRVNLMANMAGRFTAQRHAGGAT